MPHQSNRPCNEVALILIVNALHYGRIKGRDTDFYWITKDTFRKISHRSKIQDVHIKELDAELKKWGWYLVVLPGKKGYAFFRVDPLPYRWPKLTSKRLKDEGVLNMDYDDLEAYYDQLSNPGEELEPFEEGELGEDA